MDKGLSRPGRGFYALPQTCPYHVDERVLMPATVFARRSQTTAGASLFAGPAAEQGLRRGLRRRLLDDPRLLPGVPRWVGAF